MPIRYLDEEPKKTAGIKYLDEAPQQVKTVQPEKEELTTRQRVTRQLPFMGTETFEPGERSVIGNIFERPGAAMRAGIRGGVAPDKTFIGEYQKAAVAPEGVPRFAEEFKTKSEEYLAKRPYLDLISRAPLGVPLMTGRKIPEFIGNLADVATNPAELLAILASGDIKVTKTPPKITERTLAKAVQEPFMKIVKPSTRGVKNIKQLEKTRRQAAVAIDAIAENIDDLRFVDESGQFVNRAPQTLDDLSSAIHQTKKSVFQKYDAIKAQADEAGAVVELADIAKDLRRTAQRTDVKLINPTAQNYALELADRLDAQGTLSLTEAQDVVEGLNQLLKTFYRNPTADDTAKVVFNASLANRLRQKVTSAIEGVKGAKYASLRKQYGALNSIEDATTKAVIREARRNNKSLLDFTDIFTTADMVSGLARLSPGQIIKGAVGKGLKEYYKYLNKSDRLIGVMFDNVKRLKQSGTKVTGLARKAAGLSPLIRQR